VPDVSGWVIDTNVVVSGLVQSSSSTLSNDPGLEKGEMPLAAPERLLDRQGGERLQ
jgi:hypothetical protein